ncbi:hypothetical protein [Nocardioides sp. Iso805N]|uniref:hypothetical protein n=1 Tax=Nocardioides sp. Iso805N TaxID=1283287 RepID=UPI00036A8630|nr:hypothetical protein [Nocardioides sp. Iso805N]
MTDYATEPKGYEERLRAKLEPAQVRSTLAFAGLFQLTHEMLKSMVLDDVKSFFGHLDIAGEDTWISERGEHEYRREVIGLHQNRFTASLLWLQTMHALDADQAARLDDIYAHRHELTHELAKYLVDPNLEPNYELFVEALKTLKSLSRFWTEVEAGYGTFDEYPDLDLDEVTNGRILLIDLAISAFTDGLHAPDVPPASGPTAPES